VTRCWRARAAAGRPPRWLEVADRSGSR
jgi:hypothetical protein